MEREGGLDGNVLYILEKEGASNGNVLSSNAKGVNGNVLRGRGIGWQCSQ